MDLLTISDYYISYCVDWDRLFSILARFNLLKEFISCPKCKTTLKLNKTSMRFCCRKPKEKSKRRCVSNVSGRAGTFFASSKLPISKIMEIVCWWTFTRTPRLATITRETKVSRSTAVVWSNYCREVCIHWAISRSKQKIGGVDKAVDIREAKFRKGKYERVPRIDGKWLFSGVERGSDRSFIVPAPAKTREILLRIIADNILPGTTIMSDSWESYGGLQEESFKQFTIDHGIMFENNSKTVFTYSTGRSWRDLKDQFPKYGRLKNFIGYLAEIQFKQVNGGRLLLPNFLSAIAELYPGLPGP